MKENVRNTIWHDRKRNFLGLPWTFTIYELSRDRLFIDTGFFNKREDEVRLYRITDVTLTRSLWQRIVGTGTIHCDSADHTLGNFDIKNIKNAQAVKENFSKMIEAARREARVYTRESMHAGPGAMHGIDPDDYENHSPGFGPGPGFDPDFGPGRPGFEENIGEDAQADLDGDGFPG